MHRILQNMGKLTEVDLKSFLQVTTNMMIWGCMGWNGVGMLAEVDGRMDVEILN